MKQRCVLQEEKHMASDFLYWWKWRTSKGHIQSCTMQNGARQRCNNRQSI